MSKAVEHIQKLGEIKESLGMPWVTFCESYPNLKMMLEEIAGDNGTSADDLFGNKIILDRDYSEADKAVTYLSKQQIDTICSGEESEAKELQEWLSTRPGCNEMHAVIDQLCLQVF